MRRIMLLGGAVAAWPLSAWARQAERVRPLAADDAEGQTRLGAFLHHLAVQKRRQLDSRLERWTGGRNHPSTSSSRSRKFRASRHFYLIQTESKVGLDPIVSTRHSTTRKRDRHCSTWWIRRPISPGPSAIRDITGLALPYLRVAERIQAMSVPSR
jgi:hypothetical protein